MVVLVTAFLSSSAPDNRLVVSSLRTDACVYISGGQKYDRQLVMTMVIFNGDSICGWLKMNNEVGGTDFTSDAVQERLTRDEVWFSVVKLYVGDMFFIPARCLHYVHTEQGVLHSCIGWQTSVSSDK